MWKRINCLIRIIVKPTGNMFGRPSENFIGAVVLASGSFIKHDIRSRAIWLIGLGILYCEFNCYGLFAVTVC